jgi:hypothetical protein
MLDLGGYWNWAGFWRFVAFGIITPILAIGINLMGVKVSQQSTVSQELLNVLLVVWLD